MINSFFHYRVRIVSVVLVVALVFFPVRKSEALMPAVYAAMTASGITITAADLAGLAIAVAGMGAITWMAVTAPDGSTVAIPASSSSAVPAPAVTPPPVVAAHVVYGASLPPGGYATHATFCAYVGAYIAYLNWNWAPNATASLVSCNESTRVFSFDDSNGTHYVNQTNSGAYTVIQIPDTCPPGSTLVSNACVIDNPNAAANDGRQDIVRTGNSYSTVTGDQTGPTTVNIGTTTTTGDTVVFSTSPSYAAPSATTVQANPDGGTTIITYTTNNDSSGATYVTTTTINMDSTGTPISTTTVNEGGGLGTDTNGLPVVVPIVTGGGGGATLPIVIPAVPTASGGSDPIVFPNDYARQGETAAAVIPLVDALTASGVVADPVEPLVADMPGWGTTFDNLNDWVLPAHASACPRPDLDLSMVLGVGNVFTLDSHCDLMNDNGAALQAAMMAVWSMMAVFIVLRA